MNRTLAMSAATNCRLTSQVMNRKVHRFADGSEGDRSEVFEGANVIGVVSVCSVTVLCKGETLLPMKR